MPTLIKDIAEKAGVSLSTVSKVLNGSRETISEETKERVQSAALELGYQPNRMAQGLGRGKSDTICLMDSHLRNPFFLNLVQCAEDLAWKNGYMVLTDSRSLEPLRSEKGRLAGWPVDGVLSWRVPYIPRY